MKLSKFIVVIGIGSAAVLAFVRCGKKEEEKKVEAKFASLYTAVFADCGKCHAAGKEHYVNKNSDLDFATAALAYASLIKTSTVSGCTTYKYVTGGSPGKSLAYAVLTAAETDAFKTANGTACGIPAPSGHGTSDYAADTVSAVKTWITNGAAND